MSATSLPTPPLPPAPPDGVGKPSTKTESICPVCGDAASIINYGSISCLSCRTFFRRNAFPTKEVIPCRFGGQCEVNMLTRRVCTSCRLAKCLAVGMSPDLIRKEDLGATKRKSSDAELTELVSMVIPRAPIVDGVAEARPIHLSASERAIISNVVHAFDIYSPVADIRRRFEQNHITTDSHMQFDVSQSLELIGSFYRSLHLFLSSTPDFQILTSAEQRSLFQRNMLGLFSIGTMYMMRESGIFDRPENTQVLVPLYGEVAIEQAKSICQQMNCDPVLVKLLLVALAFSSSCFMLDHRGTSDRDSLLLGTFRLLGSQNMYVELMWKYLLDTYTHSDAVQRFSTLVRQLLETLRFSLDVFENNQIYQRFIKETLERIENSIGKSDQVMTPLWGRK